MFKGTLFQCIVGFLLFSIGGVLRMYMVVRVKGWSGYLEGQAGLAGAYKRLTQDRRAPLWPLPASYVLMVLGIVTVFASIILSK